MAPQLWTIWTPPTSVSPRLGELCQSGREGDTFKGARPSLSQQPSEDSKLPAANDGGVEGEAGPPERRNVEKQGSGNQGPASGFIRGQQRKQF